jgi:hypothetical protein
MEKQQLTKINNLLILTIIIVKNLILIQNYVILFIIS